MQYMLRHVRLGRESLAADIEKLGLSMDRFSMTMVHPWSDIEVQAVVLCIPSYEFPDEIETKSKATYFSHFYDDHVDRLSFDTDPRSNEIIVSEIRSRRRNINAIIDQLGDIGQLCRTVALESKDPHAVLHSIHRMTYGGLIQLSNSLAFQRVCLGEHMELALSKLTDALLAREIREGVGPSAFYSTTKTVQELLHAFEGPVDFNLCEVENLLSGPGLYFHDIGREKQVERVTFYDGLEPSLRAMKNMVRISGRWITQFLDRRALTRLRQAEFFINTFDPALPPELHEVYRETIAIYEEAVLARLGASVNSRPPVMPVTR